MQYLENWYYIIPQVGLCFKAFNFLQIICHTNVILHKGTF
jgi:hypothetical protein